MDTVAIPTRLEAALAARGLTTRDLSRSTGIRDRTLYRYVRGTREPRAGEALAIARALGVEAEELWGR